MSYPPYQPHAPGMYPPPEQATTPLSYPIYPGSAAPPAPSGYPQSMPMPSANPNQSPYPPQSTPYPPQQSDSPYPPQSSPYPPQQSGYGYPPQQSPYPPQQSPYPPQQSPYPPQQSPYPPQQSPYPPQQSPYPPQSSASPYSPQSSPYPSQSSLYPSQSTASHVHQGQGLPYGNAPYSQTHFNNSGQNQQVINKGTPTVVPANPFNPTQDAEILRKAMKGFGTDEKAIIQVLANRTNAQRQEIAVKFKTLYGKDLIKDLKSELSGNFEDLIVLLMTPISYILAKAIYDAVQGIGTDEETIIEILCTATNNDIHMIRNEFSRSFGLSMEDCLSGDTSGSFRRLLVSLCQGNRSENYIIDPAAAQGDAQALLRAGELTLGTDESTFNAILCTRSYPQLRQIFEEYQRLTGHDFTKAIKNEFSGDIEEGLLAIVNSVRDRPGYFAERLYKSMKGMGTNDRTLQRIVGIRCEIDMGEIKQSFTAKYGNSLEDFIKEDCSGDYKKALIALIS